MSMETLQVLPPVASGHTPQQCWIGTQLCKRIGAKFGQNAVVTVGPQKYLSQLWPRNDKLEGYVQLNNAVCELTDDMGAPMVNETICPEDIALQGIGSIKWINVSVVLSDYRKVYQYTSDPTLEKKLEEYVKTLLQGVSLKENYCYQCSDAPLGRLYGIAYITFNSLPQDTECARLKPSTKITIDNVTSQDRFEHKHFHRKSAPPLGGFESLVCTLKEFVEMPYLRQQELKELDATCARGCVLYGPPGSGKTSLVRHVATLTNAFMVTIQGAEILGARPGETEAALQKLFEKAHNISLEGPCILFIDELDALAAATTSKGRSSMSQRTLNQLVTLMDDMVSGGGYHVVIAATNRIAAIDPRLRQAGRLEKELLVGVPSYEQRRLMLSSLVHGLALCPHLSIAKLAEATPGYLPADLTSLVHYAWRSAQAQAPHDQAPHDQAPHDKTISTEHFTAGLHHVTPSTQRGSDVLVTGSQRRPVKFEDIGGLDEVKRQLIQAIEWPLKHAAAFQRLGIAQSKGVLLKGPPGCAKTLLVLAAAAACHVTFLSVSGAQLYSPYVGEAEAKIAEVFQQARAGAPSILFIDEIDCVVGRRSKDSKGGGVQERLLSTLLNEMDGIGSKVTSQQQQQAAAAAAAPQREKIAEGDSASHTGATEGSAPVDNSGVLVVAATNRADMLDDALVRPGRIDRIIHVPLPDLQTRSKILEVHTKKMPLETVNLAQIANQTEGFSGADLENLCREAALLALSEDENLEARAVKQHHMEHALAALRPVQLR